MTAPPVDVPPAAVPPVTPVPQPGNVVTYVNNTLPSSSPANTAPLAAKQAAWQAIGPYLTD